jgi:phthalate 4,5-dioxygenase
MYSAFRPAGEEIYYRIAQFLFPFYTMIPTGVLGLEVRVRARVPIDDGHCFGLGMHKVASVDTQDGTRGFRDPTKLLPNTTDWLGRFRTEANARNDFQIDREKQRTLQSYTGLPSVTLEDQAVTESMSEIYDRTQERLGTSDTMIIRTRRGGCSTARWSARRRPQGPAPPSARTRPACS